MCTLAHGDEAPLASEAGWFLQVDRVALALIHDDPFEVGFEFAQERLIDGQMDGPASATQAGIRDVNSLDVLLPLNELRQSSTLTKHLQCACGTLGRCLGCNTCQ
jgi:hypothetical protein